MEYCKNNIIHFYVVLLFILFSGYARQKVWYAPNKFEAYGDAEIKVVNDCLHDGWLAGFGKRTQEFENQVAKYFGKKYGLFVNSGSSANMLALHALGVGPGDEVITPACTFATTVAPIVQLGATPVFCDVIIGKYVADVEEVVKLITPKTKCILLPNLIGNKPDWKRLRALTNLPLVEDSCDTMTYTPETDIATTSFYASHIITAGGSGGMIMFNNEQLLKKATMYRDWGRIGDNCEEIGDRFSYQIDGIPYDFKFLYGALGYNMKSSEMNAAFGLIQLGKLANTKQKRRMIFEHYLTNLKNTKFILPNDSLKSDWLAFPLMTKNRFSLMKFLEENGVQTRVLFAGNITRHPAYRKFLVAFPNADRIMKEGLLIGAHHGMSLDDVNYVCKLLTEWDLKN